MIVAVIKDKALKNNPWYFTIEVGEGKDRKRIKRRGFKRKQDAVDAERDLITELNKGLNLDASKTVYRDYMNDFLNDKKTKVKSRTLGTYTSIVKNHILPTLGDLKLAEITPRHIQNLYNELFNSKLLSGENIQKVHTIINESLEKAYGWSMIIKNPAAVVDRPKADTKEMMYWSNEESHQFLEIAKTDRYYYAFLLAITTGMRQGEILGLEWQDVDTKSRTISIRQTLTHDGKELEQGTKTISGMRSIGIDKVTAAELDKLRRRTNEEKMNNRDIYEKDKNLVISTKIGTPLSPRNLNRTFERLVLNANKNQSDLETGELKKIRFHDLRHTHVVMLLKMRENNKRIAERLGWSSVKMLDRYSHISAHMQQETADAFGDMFFETQEETAGNLVPKVVPDAK
jgi:integrase